MFGINDLECFEDESERYDGDGDDKLTPVLQMT